MQHVQSTHSSRPAAVYVPVAGFFCCGEWYRRNTKRGRSLAQGSTILENVFCFQTRLLRRLDKVVEVVESGHASRAHHAQSPSNRDFPVLYEKLRIGGDSCAHFVTAGCRSFAILSSLPLRMQPLWLWSLKAARGRQVRQQSARQRNGPIPLAGGDGIELA
jgi:hypothetical protein